jgi:Xaa-Pro dipeptidase
MNLPADMHARRLAALRKVMADNDLDVVAIVPGSNQRYLTGANFGSMERPTVLIVPRAGELRMVLPFFEEATWAKLGVAARVHLWKDTAGYAGAFADAAAGLAPRRLGVEGQKMRVFEEMALTRVLAGATVVDAHQAISSIRLHKDAGEIAALRTAIKVSEAALEATLRQVRVGMTEKEIEAALLGALFAAGAEALAFPPIVAGGGNAAEPHPHASDYRLKSGDTLLFDYGASYAGYNADVTRTVFVGPPSDEARRMYAVVQEANAVGRGAAKAGTTAASVDDITTKVLEASPFAQFILTKTGHGLGLDVHEAPQIMRGNEQVLEPGMVCTIEPGLYVPGVRGIRIEDDVVVTAGAAESLTTFSRDLRIVGA